MEVDDAEITSRQADNDILLRSSSEICLTRRFCNKDFAAAPAGGSSFKSVFHMCILRHPVFAPDLHLDELKGKSNELSERGPVIKVMQVALDSYIHL